MKKAAIVFGCQFLYIMLLGLQQLNVVNNLHAGAMGVSLMLGMLGFSLTAHIADARHASIGRSPVWWAYVLAGPVGILTAMLVFAKA